MNYGNTLKKLRVRAKFTQAQVAHNLGHSSPQYVSNFERNLCTPSVHHLKGLAKMYDVRPRDILDAHMKDLRKKYTKIVLKKHRGKK